MIKLKDIPGWYHARPGYWFRPKLFGWGAVPVTWQGWVSVLVMILAGLAITRFAVATQLVMLVLLVPLIAAFVWLSVVKTDGDWRWRWGNIDE